MSFKFSANRLKGVEAKEYNDHKVSSSGEDLLHTEFYDITKHRAAQPELNAGETVLSGTIYGKSATVVVTDQRILLYDVSSVEKHPYTVEIAYESNEYGLPPLARLIPGPAESDSISLDLLVVDPVAASVRYIQSIDLSPSFDALQNEHKLDLGLSRGEVVTLTSYNEEVGLVLATSDHRISLVTLRDQLGRVQLHHEDVIPSKASFSFLRRGGYNDAAFKAGNKVSSLRFRSETTLLTRLYVVEEDGLLTVVNFVSGSGYTVVLRQNVRDAFLVQVKEPDQLDSFIITDMRPLDNHHCLFLATFGSSEAGYSLVLFDISVAGERLATLESKYLVRSTKSAQSHPSLFVLDSNAIIFAQNTGVVFADTEQFTEEGSWEDFVALSKHIKVYGTSDTVSTALQLLTADGVISIKMLAKGKRIASSDFVRLHIEQYLEFGNTGSPVKFSLGNKALDVTPKDSEQAVLSIIQAVLDNSLPLLSSYVVTGSNLEQRFAVLKSLARYVHENLTGISSDVRMQLANAVEEAGIASLTYNNYSDSLGDVTKKHYKNTVQQFFNKHLGESADLLYATITDLTSEVGNEKGILLLASSLNDVLTTGYISPERDVKSALLDVVYDSSVKTRPLFLERLPFLKEVNSMIAAITTSYADELDSGSDSDLKTSISTAILGLSLFLYYTLNDLLQYTASQGPELAPSTKQLQAFYDTNKENWIRIFILLRKQDEMIKLVDGFGDLSSMAQLLDSERAYVEDPAIQETVNPIELENLGSEVEAQFDKCFDTYGYAFAEKLFSYYVHSNQIDLLLTRFSKYSEFLNKFLGSNVEYWRFAWILDVQDGNYDDSAHKLLKYVASSDDPVENRQLQLNIAKLSLLASDSASAELSGIQVNLSILELQQLYQQALLVKFGQLGDSQASTLVNQSHYLSSNSFSYLSERAKSLIVNNVATRLPLSLFELVELFTLVDFSTVSLDSFDDVFKLLGKIVQSSGSRKIDDSQYRQRLIHVFLSLAFKRVILSDDWDSIANGKDLMDSKFLSTLSQLPVYKLGAPSSVSQLYITDDDLNYLGVPTSSHSDYFKENDLLSRLDRKVDLSKWLNTSK